MRDIVSPLDGFLSPFGVVRGAWSPSTLFASGETGAWYEPSPTNCFQQSDGTVAAGVGDPVGYIADLSGNGNHATQATAAARPTLRQTGGGLYYLEFDGVDDNFEITGSGSTKDWSFSSAATINEASNDGVLFAAYNASSDRVIFYPNCTITGTGGERFFVVDTSIVDVGGISLTGSTLVQSVRSSSADHYVRRDGASVGISTNAKSANMFPAKIGRYDVSAQYGFFDLYGFILRQGEFSEAELSNVESYLATKSGVTL